MHSVYSLTEHCTAFLSTLPLSMMIFVEFYLLSTHVTMYVKCLLCGHLHTL